MCYRWHYNRLKHVTVVNINYSHRPITVCDWNNAGRLSRLTRVVTTCKEIATSNSIFETRRYRSIKLEYTVEELRPQTQRLGEFNRRRMHSLISIGTSRLLVTRRAAAADRNPAMIRCRINEKPKTVDRIVRYLDRSGPPTRIRTVERWGQLTDSNDAHCRNVAYGSRQQRYDRGLASRFVRLLQQLQATCIASPPRRTPVSCFQWIYLGSGYTRLLHVSHFIGLKWLNAVHPSFRSFYYLRERLDSRIHSMLEIRLRGADPFTRSKLVQIRRPRKDSRIGEPRACIERHRESNPAPPDCESGSRPTDIFKTN